MQTTQKKKVKIVEKVVTFSSTTLWPLEAPCFDFMNKFEKIYLVKLLEIQLIKITFSFFRSSK